MLARRVSKNIRGLHRHTDTVELHLGKLSMFRRSFRRLRHHDIGGKDEMNSRCPECGSADVARIVYGGPIRELALHYRGENVLFGGDRCWGDERDPQFGCQSCGLHFGQIIPLTTSPGFATEDPEDDRCPSCGSSATWFEMRGLYEPGAPRRSYGAWLGCRDCATEWPDAEPHWVKNAAGFVRSDL
jgi:hypothetical protein